MNSSRRSEVVWLLAGALGSAALIACGVLLSGPLNAIIRPDRTADLHGQLQAAVLHASSATSSEHFAMASGEIDEDTEGVFVLDFETGDLKCTVLNYRSGKFSALFQTNVAKDLGPSKNAKYQMVTGTLDFHGGVSSARPATSVVYVLDSSSGRMAAYAVPWKREAAATGRTQLGMLKAIDQLDLRDSRRSK